MENVSHLQNNIEHALINTSFLLVANIVENVHRLENNGEKEQEYFEYLDNYIVDSTYTHISFMFIKK